MSANRRKILFLCTLIMLGIGLGILLIYDEYRANKNNFAAVVITSFIMMDSTIVNNPIKDHISDNNESNRT